MRSVDIGDPDCKKVLALLDFYLSSELTIEMTTEVIRHLERCPQCLGIFRIRELVKRRLQAAVSQEELSPEMSQRVSRMIRKTSRSWIRRALE
jgi:predicted anti-sigma-YlaC factor YlaD